jgi:DNA repair photolyase
LAAGAEAGADAASWIMLRLPREVSALWQEWLSEHEPNRAAKVMDRLRQMHGGRDYDPRWGHRMRGEGVYADMIARRFRAACRRLSLQEKSPPLRCDTFAIPPQTGDQLALF